MVIVVDSISFKLPISQLPISALLRHVRQRLVALCKRPGSGVGCSVGGGGFGFGGFGCQHGWAEFVWECHVAAGVGADRLACGGLVELVLV